MLDLDNFKKVNDAHGHVEGDRVLMQAAALVRESLREIDVAARYGGEEFAVVLPDTPRIGAHLVAERIRRRIEEHFARRRAATRVTISGGVAVFPDDAGTPADLHRAGRRRPLRRQGRGQEPHHCSAGREAPLPAPDVGPRASRWRRAPGARPRGSRTSPRAACS